MKHSLFVTCAVTTLLLTGSAFAETDEAFLDKAMQINLSEISMGQLAQQRGTSDAVKQYGQRLVIDHISNAGQVIALVRDMGQAPATEPPSAEMAIHDQLMSMNGADFDSAFANRMIEGHQQAIKLFEVKASEDGEVADYAKATLPALQEHLQLAQAIVSGSDQQATNAAPSNNADMVAPSEDNQKAASTDDVPTTEQQAATSEEVVQERQRPTATVSDSVSRDMMQLAAPGTISAESLMGVTVYGADNESIGEVSDVILAKDGSKGAIEAVILDAGGFLGIGEKPVAVSFDSLEIMTDEDKALHAYSKFTKEQLEAAAEYDPETYEANRGTMLVRPQG